MSYTEPGFRPQGEEYWKNRQLNDKKKDWKDLSGNWVDGYTKSVDHPHRDQILDMLHSSGVNSVLEVGCNSGPNLIRISKQLPGLEIAGIDLNSAAIECARNNLPWSGNLKVGSVLDIPFPDKSFDAVLCDAVLMYISPSQIEKAMSELQRVSKYVLLLIEWHDTESNLGVIKDFHWARNYLQLMLKLGYTNVTAHKLTEKEWPSKNWIRNGWLYAGLAPRLKISEINS